MIDSIPKVLYKYRQYEGANQESNYGARTLLNFELFASSPSRFNDPFDMALPYKYTPKSFTLKNFKKRFIGMYNPMEHGKMSYEQLLMNATKQYFYIRDNPETHWRENADKINGMNSKFYGVLSLSSNVNNILMWSHYADYHKGFSIGLDGAKLSNLANDISREDGYRLLPVNYSNDYPEVDFMNESTNDSIFKRLFTKQKCWGYEEEYRLAFTNKSDISIKYPKELIKEIYLGCRMPDEHIKEIKLFLKENDLTEVKLYQMEMSYHRFELESKLLSLDM